MQRSVYHKFVVKKEAHKYQLTVSEFQTSQSNATDKLNTANDQQFTTRDKDNDNVGAKNCAQKCGGGFWYDQCACSITGAWNNFKWGGYDVDSAEMYLMCD